MAAGNAKPICISAPDIFEAGIKTTVMEIEQEQLDKATFSQVVRAPVTYMLMVAISLLWFFVYRFGASSDQINRNCEAEKAELRKELIQSRADKDALMIALLIKNGIILQQAREQMHLDSTRKKNTNDKTRNSTKRKENE